MVAGAAAVIVLAALLFARWVVQLAQRAERYEVELRMERVLRENKDAQYEKLVASYQQLRTEYAALARKSVGGASDDALVDMLGDGLLEPDEDDRGPGPSRG